MNLPDSAKEALRKAASTPTDKDPHARAKAIDETIDRLRLVYPDYFKDDHGENHRRECEGLQDRPMEPVRKVQRPGSRTNPPTQG